MAQTPDTFDVIDYDLKRHLKAIDEEEMQLDNEITIKIYDRDYGYGRIVLRHPDGTVYLEEDVEGAGEAIKDFIRERMGK